MIYPKMLLAVSIICFAGCQKKPEVASLLLGKRIQEDLQFSREIAGLAYLQDISFGVIEANDDEYTICILGEVKNKSDLKATFALVAGAARSGEPYYWNVIYPDGVIKGWNYDINLADFLDVEWSIEENTGWVE